ncbi:hypothetical protein HYC85_023245 [Camellia sinensis]|uniref:Uncharacterized protein n=1 Tax=Camellia sinensis TaxID=4442 RepID=A0A7J7GHW0_CAMSI|nr:hypothetical protein HYC85_023245 [Camellia sinensis]
MTLKYRMLSSEGDALIPGAGEQNETNTVEGENIGDAVDHFVKTRVSLSLSRILHGRLLCNGNRAYPLHCGWALTARDDNPCRHRRLEKLYFLTASRVLFSNPPHISKFWTFPVVQLFLTCISSLAGVVQDLHSSALLRWVVSVGRVSLSVGSGVAAAVAWCGFLAVGKKNAAAAGPWVYSADNVGAAALAWEFSGGGCGVFSVGLAA